MKAVYLVAFFCLILATVISQNEATKWYLNSGVGLNFMTSPLTLISGSSMNSTGLCGSLADSSGALQLYTDCNIIWNAQNQSIQNGTGLSGEEAGNIAPILLKKPGGGKKYYLFYIEKTSLTRHLVYSIADLALAGGTGSVTVKNKVLIPDLNPPNPLWQMAAIHNASVTGYWVVFRESPGNKFLAYRLTALGLDTVPVISNVGPSHPAVYNIGSFRFSPNGQKLAVASKLSPTGLFLFGFDPLTGIVQNPITLSTNSYWALEFSSDGTKLYGTKGSPDTLVNQWDLCAGDSGDIVNSMVTINVAPKQPNVLQLAPDGKIYISGTPAPTLGVIHFPNIAGAGCSVQPLAQPTGTPNAGIKLPTFVKSYFNHVPGIFTYSLAGCGAASFTAPCLGPNTYSGVKWNFGEPASVTSNTSIQHSPTHQYGAPGIYTVILQVLAGTLTTNYYQVINVTSLPNITLSGNLTICKGEATTFTASGAVSYSWNGIAGAPIKQFTPTSTLVYTLSGSDNQNCFSTKIFSVQVLLCASIEERFDADIQIYPNPASGIFTVVCPPSMTAIVRDELGRSLFVGYIAENQLDLSFLADGMYLLEVKNESFSKILRIIKRE